MNVSLTPREREIMVRVVQGKTNAMIAGELDIKANTVRNRLLTIYDKLGIESQPYNPRVRAAVQFARDENRRDFEKMMEFAALVVEHGRALQDYE